MNAAKTGALIAQMRKEKGLTQRELAERVYVSVQAVSKWELGKNFPDLSLMEPLSDILDLTVSELLAGERGEAPKDELVRDTLRLGEEQFRPKIKRWRGLFIAAAIVLAAVLAALGYAWLRDNTQLLPQRETVFTPIELEEEQNALVDLLTLPNNWDFLRMYRVALADGMDQVVFKAELWSQRHDVGPERELVDSWHLWTGYPRAGQKTEPRHHLLAFRLTFLEDGSLQYKIKLGGSTMMTTKALLEELPAPITGMSWSASAGEPATVDRENGAVLLELGMTLESEPKSYFFLIKAYWE
jgi:transcriptional regulator with XRE-family HTH domain